MKALYEQFGGTYRKESDYTIPNLKMPEAENVEIGIYGQWYLNYLQTYRKLTYINLLTSGKLNEHLAQINKQAWERLEFLIIRMKETQGITEQVKTDNSMEWVGRMNCIRLQAEEIVLYELIYQ